MPNKRRTNTLWRLDEWAELPAHQLRRKLLEGMADSGADLERFWSKVRKGKPDECWEWKSYFDKDGYGVMRFHIVKLNKRVGVRTHRISYFLHHRELVEDMCVCHHCDNPKCVNPKHLFLGTQGDNTHDRDIKGRHRPTRGETNGAAVLTASQVQEIRILWFVGKVSAPELASLFGVSRGCINGIVYGVNWKHLPLPKEILNAF